MRKPNWQDESGIALIVGLLVMMVVLSLSITVVQLAQDESQEAAKDRKRSEAAQAADTAFAEYLAVLPTSSSVDLCEEWDADAREVLGDDRAIPIIVDGYPQSYELDITFTDDGGTDLDCADFDGSQVLDTALVTATSLVGRATGNSTTVQRRFQMALDLEPIPSVGVEQAVYGASNVTLAGNKTTYEDTSDNDATIYSGCNLDAAASGGSNMQSSLVAGCDITNIAGYVYGNVWAGGDITFGSACIGHPSDCGGGNPQEEWGWVVSSGGDVDVGAVWAHQPCVAVTGSVTKSGGGSPNCDAKTWPGGAANNPWGSGPPAYVSGSCPTEAQSYSFMGRNICDDPPTISFPAWSYDFVGDWAPAGYTEVLGASYAGATNAAKCLSAETAIETGYVAKTVVNLLGMDCALDFSNATIKNDLAIITDGSVHWGSTTWTGLAGMPRNVAVIHPKGETGGLTFCPTNAGGNGGYGADAQDDFSMTQHTQFNNLNMFVYTPCHFDGENKNGFSGQIIAGTVSLYNNGDTIFEKMNVPGLGSPLGYLPTILWQQELPTA